MSRPIRTFGVWLISVSLGFERQRQRPELRFRDASRPPSGDRSPRPARPGAPSASGSSTSSISRPSSRLTPTSAKSGAWSPTRSLRCILISRTVELDCGPKLKVSKVTVGDEVEPLQIRHQGRQAVGHARQGLRAWRYHRPGDRILRLARARALLRHARGALSREAALVLDAGRVRGNARLAPLLRLSQRARHHRDDHHGGKAPVRPVQRRAWSKPRTTRTTRRLITGR